MAEHVQARKKHGEEIVIWLKENYELEETTGCISKASVYHDYLVMCHHERLQPTTGPAFGKLVRRAFPSVASNRRGPRGHALHMYSGLRKRAVPIRLAPDDGASDLMSPSSPPTHSFTAIPASTSSGFTMPVTPDLSSPVLAEAGPRKAQRQHQVEGEVRRQQLVPQPEPLHLQYGVPAHLHTYGSESPTFSPPTMPPHHSGAPSWMTSLARSEQAGDDGSWRLTAPAIEPDLPHPPNRFAFIPPRATFDSIAEWATARVEERVEKGDSSEEMTSVGSDSMEEAAVELHQPTLDAAWHNRVSTVFPTRSQGVGQTPLQQQRTSSTAPRMQQSLSAEFYPIPATAHFLQYQPPPFSFSASHTPVAVVGSPPTSRPPPRPRSASGVDTGFHPSAAHYHQSGGWDVYDSTADATPAAVEMSTSSPSFPHYGFQVTVGSPLSTMRTAPFEEKPSPRGSSNSGNRGAVAASRSGPFHAVQQTAPRTLVTTLVRERQLNTPINFDQGVSPDANDAPHYSEVAALTSMCRFYYANLFKNVLACNLEGLQLDIDRFWEYVANNFLGLFFYESVCHRLLQIEKSVLHEVSDALMVHPIEQRAMYMHKVAVLLPTFLARRKALLPAPLFASLHQIVTDFAVQLYSQAKHLQTLGGHNTRPSQ